MPHYDYKCKECEHEFVQFQNMSDDKLTKCPECEKESLKRLIGNGSSILFNCDGFYDTDYNDKRVR